MGAHIITQAMEFLDCFHIQRPCIILAVYDYEHFVLTYTLANQNINLPLCVREPTIKLHVVKHLCIWRQCAWILATKISNSR